jgi:hypothetical protein
MNNCIKCNTVFMSPTMQKEYCTPCWRTHRLAYNKRKYREKVMRESLGTFYSRFQSGLRNNIQARGVII